MIDSQEASLQETSIFNPATDAIEDVLQRMKQHGTKLRSYDQEVHSGSKLCDLGDGRLVKSGHRVSVAEAQTMLFIRAQTAIPVPQVFMVFTRDNMVHIVMEIVNGFTLQDAVFRRLISPADLHAVVLQLHTLMHTIHDLGRELYPSKVEFGSWPAGPYANTYFSESRPATTFTSEQQFHAYWIALAEDAENYCELSIAPPLRDFVHSNAHQLDSKPLLCHGDLSPRNIIVEGGRIAAVLDWETFGWYPAFWEIMAARNSPTTKALKKEMLDIFGEDPEIAQLYRFLFAGINNSEVHTRRFLAKEEHVSHTVV